MHAPGAAIRIPLGFVLVGLAGCTLDGRQRPEVDVQCEVAGAGQNVADLREGSGIAASRRVAGRFWAHNDSGEPVLYALDRGGAVAGRLRIRGADVEDWEALAVGPCPAGSCLYVGDIGDNDAERPRVTIYRVAEPAAADGSAEAEAFHARYPDEPHDAETLIVTPGGELFIVTKGETGPVALYRFPQTMQPGETVTLEQVGRPRARGEVDRDDRITDGAASPDGAWIALRTRETLHLHPAQRLMSGDWRESARVDLAELDEPQGEGVTFAAGATLALLSEGGGKKRPGLLSHLRCTLPPSAG